MPTTSNEMFNNFTEYLCITGHNDFDMDEFLLPTAMQIYRNYATKTTSVATILAPIRGEGVKGTREIVRETMINIHRISHNIV